MIKSKHPKNKAERRLIDKQKALKHSYAKGNAHGLRRGISQTTETEEGSGDLEGVYRGSADSIHSRIEDQESGYTRPN